MNAHPKETNPPAIDVCNLSVFVGEKTPIEGLSFRVDPGEKVLVTGKSGAGKTTLLQCILGFVPPLKGSVKLFGHAVDGHSVWGLRAQVAYVPQEAELGFGTVRQVLEEPFSYRANGHLKGNLEKIPLLFERFLLSQDLLDSNVDAISGGEKQRIAIVCAILLSRPVYLLDEISSALDASSKDRVIEYFSERTDESILTISHDERWKKFADRIIEL